MKRLLLHLIIPTFMGVDVGYDDILLHVARSYTDFVSRLSLLFDVTSLCQTMFS